MTATIAPNLKPDRAEGEEWPALRPLDGMHEDPYFDATQGRPIRSGPFDDATQGRTTGSDPFDDATRAR